MTCLVGMLVDVDDGTEIYIGADRLISTPTSGAILKGSKIFTVGDMIIGYSGSLRYAQILDHGFTPPEFKADDTVERYLVNSFFPDLLVTLTEHQCLLKENELAGYEGVFLLGIRGRLFKIQSDFSFLEYQDTFCASGAGEDFALGSLATTDQFDLDPALKISLAIEASTKYSHFVGGEPDIKKLFFKNGEVEERE